MKTEVGVTSPSPASRLPITASSSPSCKAAVVPKLLSVLTAVLVSGLAGCTLATATPPSVDVTDLRLVGVGMMEQQLAVTLCVTNPNADELAFRHVTADLDVSGALLAAGSSNLSVRLPPLSSTMVPFTVITTVQNLGPQLLGVARSGTMQYRVHGTIALNGALGITLPYSRSGRLDPVAAGLGLVSAASDPTPSRCVAQALRGPQA